MDRLVPVLVSKQRLVVIGHRRDGVVPMQLAAVS